MANQPQQDKGSNGTLKIVLIGVLTLGAAGFGLAAGFGAGSSLNGGPNPNGAQAAQIIDPTPTSPIYRTLGDAKRDSKPDDYLSQNSAFLDTYAQNLQKLAAMLAPVGGDQNTATDPAFAKVPGANIKQMRDIVTRMLTQEIPTIRQYVGANTPAQALPTVKNLIADRARLDDLWLPQTVSTMIDTGKALVIDNVNSNYTKYQYSQAQRSNLTQGITPALSDCSSFISFLLMKAGVNISPKTPFDTATLYSMAKNSEMGLTLVEESSTADGIPQTDITSNNLLQPGDIILSGVGPFSAGKPDQAHAAMYIGPGTDHAGDIIESSDRSGGRNGLQFNTLANRFASKNPIQAIIRYGGGQ